jgi:hypothetical protein
LAEESNGQEKKDLMPSYGGHDAVAVSAEEEDKYYTKRTAFAEEAERDEFMELASIEEIFSSEEVPSWQKQLTLRAFVVSFILTVLFTFIVMKLNLTTGIIPSLNVSAGLLGFFFVKTWTNFLEKAGMLRQPFTRQENTVIQTCVVASSGIAFSGTLFISLKRTHWTTLGPPCMHMCAYLFIFLKLHFYN